MVDWITRYVLIATKHFNTNYMSRLRIAEAMEKLEQKGNKIKKIQIAEKLWPKSSRKTQQMNIANLIDGKTKRVDIEWVSILCEVLECNPSFLFNHK